MPAPKESYLSDTQEFPDTSSLGSALCNTLGRSLITHSNPYRKFPVQYSAEFSKMSYQPLPADFPDQPSIASSVQCSALFSNH